MIDNKTAIKTLQDATRALSGVCDGASSLDGAGFNGADTDFGKSLAQRERWSPKQAVAAQKMLGKYAGQLRQFGIDISELPALKLEELMTEQPARPKVQSRVILSEDGEYIEFHFDYSYEEKEFVKNTFHAFWRPAEKIWRKKVGEVTTAQLDSYHEQFNACIEWDMGKAVAATEQVTAATVELSTAKDADISALDLSRFAVTPFPFQRAGIAYGVAKKRVIIGDDMGLGKTYQAIGIGCATGTIDRCVVVCPASVKINWQREIAIAAKGVTTAIWDGKGGPEANCIIINYDNLKKNLPRLLAFGPRLLIIDELHYLKTAKAARTLAALELAKGIEYILGLTGTPIMNRPDELAAPLTILGRLDEFGGWFQFVKRYCNAHKRRIPTKSKGGGVRWVEVWDTSGARNLEELNSRLKAVCMVRRKKSDVLTELPEKQRARLVFPITNRKAYNSAQDNLKAFCAAKAAEDKAFLEIIKHLDPAERAARIQKQKIEAAESADRAEQLVMIETLKQLATEGKMDAAVEWVQDFLETGEKLVLFATHVEAQRELCKRFPGAARIAAEDGPDARQAHIDRFRTDPDCRLIVCSLAAGGTGVNGLQDVCSNVAFLELPWTPAACLQAEDRVHRIGQAGQVMAYYLLAEDTIEEAIQAMLAAKQAICDSVLDGAEETRTGSIFNELMDVMTNGAL